MATFARVALGLMLLARTSGASLGASVRPWTGCRAGRTLRSARTLMAEQPISLDLGFLTGAGLAGASDDGPVLSEGDRVRVIAEGLAFFHVPKHSILDPHGLEGVVVRVFDCAEVSANLPVVVAFEAPRTFRAHFEPSELERL
ncbi:hypothetical protein KFE25_007039 [Diacronema lutheri]|uniref:Ferredoxin thioredoxin reductase alpha chain domain-containing protein n=1 Tax=Diacronema lutheri TaxID=2081491 RepID=A0A8J5XT97_DIALT|nr:hypothetical protein KFE25_007039 [Diacronema lutheri]